MLCINPDAAPFALTPDHEVPEAIRDTVYWDDHGDVLLVTKDGIVCFLRMNLLLRYSETVKCLLGHVAEVPQDGLWTPILELECSATELRAVLEYLLLRERGTHPSVDSLARYAFSAYTLGIKTLDEAALTGLLIYARERLNAYANWDGIAEVCSPPVRSVHAILAARVLPEPASSILPIAFIDLSVFGFGQTAQRPEVDASKLKLRGPYDEDTIALLQERNAEFVDTLLRLSANFGRRRSVSRVGRPCCNFGTFVVDHTPHRHVDAAVKGRSAMAIIAALGTEVERARATQALAEDRSRPQYTCRQAFEHGEKASCLSCLSELHQGMRRLYGEWWEDMGRLLMGEPVDGRSSAWDGVRNRLSACQTPVSSSGWQDRLQRFLCGLYRVVVDFPFRR